MIYEQFFLRCCRDGSTEEYSRIRCIEDSLPVSTWRQEFNRDVCYAREMFRYPEEGCHGSPLENDYPNRRNTP